MAARAPIQASQKLLNLLKDFHANGSTIVMVTHDPRYASFADRTIHMLDGRIVNQVRER